MSAPPDSDGVRWPADLRGGLTTFMVMAYIKLVRGKARAVHPMMWGATVAFAVYFALPVLRAARVL